MHNPAAGCKTHRNPNDGAHHMDLLAQLAAAIGFTPAEGEELIGRLPAGPGDRTRRQPDDRVGGEQRAAVGRAHFDLDRLHDSLRQLMCRNAVPV